MEPRYRLLTYSIIGLSISLISLFVIPAFTVSMIARNWGQEIYPFPYNLFLLNFSDYFLLYFGASFGFGFVVMILIVLRVELD